MPANRSASMRALAARLQLLKRPTVWGSALIVIVPLFLLADYWQNPDQATRNQSASDPTLSAGRIPSRTTPFDPSSLPEVPISEIPSSGAFGQTNVLDGLLTPPLSSPSKQSTEQKTNPRSPAAASSLSKPSELSSPFPASTVGQPATAGSGTASSSSTSQSTQPLSPLQSALNRSAGQPNAQTSDPSAQPAAQTPTAYGQPYGSSFGTSGQTTVGQPTVGQASSQPSGYQPYVFQTAPAPGTTGYTVPPAFRTPANTPGYPNSTYPNSTSITPQTAPALPNQAIPNSYGRTPGYSSTAPNFSAPTYTSPQSAQPAFSVPRTAPGQYIGGGEINTFSNP